MLKFMTRCSFLQ